MVSAALQSDGRSTESPPLSFDQPVHNSRPRRARHLCAGLLLVGLAATQTASADSGTVRFDGETPAPVGDLAVSAESAELDTVYTSTPHWRVILKDGYLEFSFSGNDEFRYRALGSTIGGVSQCYVDVYINGVLYEEDKFIDDAWEWFSLPGSLFSVGNNTVKIVLVGDSHLWVHSAEAIAADGGGMHLGLEDPMTGGTYSGIGNIRGWAVGPNDILHLEIDVDGEFFAYAPIGGSRPDVEAVYTTLPNSGTSGYAMAVNYGLLTPGQHQITARAIDNHGNRVEQSADITVAGYQSEYVEKASDVDFSSSSCSTSADGVNLTNVLVEGVGYDLHLNWSQASQGVVIDQITETAPTP